MTVEELEAYFNGITLPEKVQLVQGVVIEDVPLFLQSHFSYIKNNGTLKSADVFLRRLNELHVILEAKYPDAQM
jgi:hypothetical protein